MKYGLSRTKILNFQMKTWSIVKREMQRENKDEISGPIPNFGWEVVHPMQM